MASWRPWYVSADPSLKLDEPRPRDPSFSSTNIHRATDADSDEVAPAYRYDRAPGFRHDVAPWAGAAGDGIVGAEPGTHELA